MISTKTDASDMFALAIMDACVDNLSQPIKKKVRRLVPSHPYPVQLVDRHNRMDIKVSIRLLRFSILNRKSVHERTSQAVFSRQLSY
jgi:hypothetical protein